LTVIFSSLWNNLTVVESLNLHQQIDYYKHIVGGFAIDKN
jgi:hypothetical protein